MVVLYVFRDTCRNGCGGFLDGEGGYHAMVVSIVRSECTFKEEHLIRLHRKNKHEVLKERNPLTLSIKQPHVIPLKPARWFTDA
jgi:hypothetical protein